MLMNPAGHFSRLIPGLLLALLPLAACSPLRVLQSDRQLVLQERGDGLPHEGQWRAEAVVTDLDRDGIAELVLPAPRKGGGRPQIFRWQAAGESWQRVPVAFPPYRFDYGGVAALDFDGDGMTDLVFGMHLKGLAATRQVSAWRFEDASDGLNQLVSGAPSIAGALSLRALPAVAGEGAPRLLSVYEPGSQQGPGVSIWRVEQGRWLRRDVTGAPVGLQLTLASPDRAHYLSSRGIVAVDVNTAESREVARLRHGDFAHALAVGHDGRTGRDHAYVASSHFAERAWLRRVERVAELSPDTVPSPDRVLLERHGEGMFTALALVRADAWGVAGEMLAVGGDDGGIQVLNVDADAAVRARVEVLVPAWRTGCAVSHLQWAPLSPGGTPRLFVMFSEENSPLAGGEACRKGGGLTVFELGLGLE